MACEPGAEGTQQKAGEDCTDHEASSPVSALGRPHDKDSEQRGSEKGSEIVPPAPFLGRHRVAVPGHEVRRPGEERPEVPDGLP